MIDNNNLELIFHDKNDPKIVKDLRNNKEYDSSKIVKDLRNNKKLDTISPKLSGKKIVNVMGTVKDAKKFKKITTTKQNDSTPIETIKKSDLNVEIRKNINNNFIEEES